ncbi:hypothetical protein BJX99DRAFT_241927 [Aspergillus californicus]
MIKPNMKTILVLLACLAFAVAIPIEPAELTPTSTTTTTATSTSTSTTTATTRTTATTESTETSKPNISNLCQGKYSDTGLAGVLSLGKLEECAGNTIGDRPLSHILDSIPLLSGSWEGGNVQSS